MARAMCCDRCGEFFKFDDNTYCDRKYKLLDHTKRGTYMLNGDWVDICDNCYKKLEQFMEGKDLLLPAGATGAAGVYTINENGTVVNFNKED